MVGYGEAFGLSPLEVERFPFCDFCETCDDWLEVSAKRDEDREARERAREKGRAGRAKTRTTVPVTS